MSNENYHTKAPTSGRTFSASETLYWDIQKPMELSQQGEPQEGFAQRNALDQQPSVKPEEARWWSLRWWKDQYDTYQRADDYRVAAHANKDSVRLLKIDLENKEIEYLNACGRIRNVDIFCEQLEKEIATEKAAHNITRTIITSMEGVLMNTSRRAASYKGKYNRLKGGKR